MIHKETKVQYFTRVRIDYLGGEVTCITTTEIILLVGKGKRGGEVNVLSIATAEIEIFCW